MSGYNFEVVETEKNLCFMIAKDLKVQIQNCNHLETILKRLHSIIIIIII